MKLSGELNVDVWVQRLMHMNALESTADLSKKETDLVTDRSAKVITSLTVDGYSAQSSQFQDL